MCWDAYAYNCMFIGYGVKGFAILLSQDEELKYFGMGFHVKMTKTVYLRLSQPSTTLQWKKNTGLLQSVSCNIGLLPFAFDYADS